ncbi:MAG: HAD-IA family hydrolase [Burkholderiales bacterium]|nr:HAD-IA family hydrolase [Burkholderiales bacterium]
MTTLEDRGPQRYDLIVFDWDGTIMDSTGLIAECIQLAATDRGLSVPSLDEAKSIIGLGIHESTRRLFPALDHVGQTAFAAAYRHHFVCRDHEAPLYEGIRELLVDINQPERFLAVATGKPRAGLERAFTHTGLKSAFHFSRCADEGFAKPHPDMLLRLMDIAAVGPDRTLMIGDTVHDLDLAANAGVAAVAVTYGAHSAELLASRPSLCRVGTVNELNTWLKLSA